MLVGFSVHANYKAALRQRFQHARHEFVFFRLRLIKGVSKPFPSLPWMRITTSPRALFDLETGRTACNLTYPWEAQPIYDLSKRSRSGQSRV
jgi:hypothetical protein